ncbi:MAG: glycoside hydrolase family 88/105 protein [Candidatus Zipacnadales bacterium]
MNGMGLATVTRSLAIALMVTALYGCTRSGNPKSGDAVFWGTGIAETIMRRHADGYGDWDYVTGTVLRGFEEMWRVTGDDRYFWYVKMTLDRVVTESGDIKGYDPSKYSLDDIQEARMLLFLYTQTKEEKYRQAAVRVRQQLEGHPRAPSGGFWHKRIYPNQMWLDGLYMAQPFYAEYASLFAEPETFDDVVRQFDLVARNMRDARTGLYYHGWDETKQAVWADPRTGLSPCLWARALGWYIMAIVDVLDFLPQDYAGRESLVRFLQDLAAAVRRFQDKKTGLWWQVVNQGERQGNYLESSASAMFVYALAKGVRMGYLSSSYLRTARKGFAGLISHMAYRDSAGNFNLVRICKSAGLGGDYQDKIRDGSYEYYVYMEPVVANDGKGLGPFLTACAEMVRLTGK